MPALPGAKPVARTAGRFAGRSAARPAGKRMTGPAVRSTARRTRWRRVNQALDATLQLPVHGLQHERPNGVANHKTQTAEQRRQNQDVQGDQLVADEPLGQNRTGPNRMGNRRRRGG